MVFGPMRHKKYTFLIERILYAIRIKVSRFLELFGFTILTVGRRGFDKTSIRVARAQPGRRRAVFEAFKAGSVNPHKYFTIDHNIPAGIDHQKEALTWLIAEAVSLNRTPILFPPLFLSNHNYGKKVHTRWDKYIDVTNITATQRGRSIRLNVPAQEEIPNFCNLSVARVSGEDRVMVSDNQEYDIIIRENRSGLKIPSVHDIIKIEVNFSPSSGVVCHYESVSQKLKRYNCIHVRRTDKLEALEQHPDLVRETGKAAVLETVSQLLSKNIPIYIMTDEKDKHYFDMLRKDYTVYQYFDFPELKNIVENESPDNFFLYEIEKLIFKNAKIKIYTFKDPMGKPRLSLSQSVGWT